MRNDTEPAETREETQRPAGGIVRAWQDKPELRARGDNEMPTLVSRFAVFDTWTEINSWFEGRFMERISPGSFKKTFKENVGAIRALFQHGHDPQIGSKVLGPVEVLREEDDGAWGEVALLDTSYNRDLIPGLEAGQYGSSFRFEVMREDRDPKPERAEHNPEGIEERTVREVRLFEFGPVTFPAYADATAGLRSLTDEMFFDEIARNPSRARELLELGSTNLLANVNELATELAHEREAPPTGSAEPQPKAAAHPARTGRRTARAIYTKPKASPRWQL